VSRDFRLLFAAQSVTFFGSMMTFVTLQWQVFELTESTVVVGLLSVGVRADHADGVRRGRARGLR